MATVIDGDFEWEDQKAALNLSNHGVSFEEAATAFADPRAAILDDGSDTDVYRLIGFSTRPRMLVVVHVVRGVHHQRLAGYSG